MDIYIRSKGIISIDGGTIDNEEAVVSICTEGAEIRLVADENILEQLENAVIKARKDLIKVKAKNVDWF